MLQGFQVPHHNHMLMAIAFNQYLGTILRLLPCYSLQRPESYLLNVLILESMSASPLSLSLSLIVAYYHFILKDLDSMKMLYE
jgi:hypothetical protein